MATFQISNKNKKSTKNKKKLIGAILLALSTVVFLFSVTSLIPALQTFFLGILGIFVYPLSVFGLLLSLALLNDKKYVMPKRYAVLLLLSLYFFLCILQLIIVGLPGENDYASYIALNYTNRFTAGGIIIGFLPCSLAYLMGGVATYIVFALAFVVCVVFFVETILSLKKNEKQSEPVKLNIKEKSTTQKQVVYDKSPKIAKILTPQEDVNVMFGAQLPKEKETEPKIPEGMTIRDYLLQPPTVDIEKFMANKNKRTSQPITNLNTSDINNTLNQMKQQEQINPSTYVHEENYDFSQPEIKRGNLPEMKPEQITSQAEDIIREVVKEEISQMHNDNVSDDEFIDYSSISNEEHEYDSSSQTQSFDRSNLSRDRSDFSRDRSDFSRDRQLQTNRLQDERKPDAILSRDSGISERQHAEQTERQKRFVQLDDESKTELVKAYN